MEESSETVIEPELMDGALYVNDVLRLASFICDDLFGKGNYGAKHVIAVYDRIEQRRTEAVEGDDLSEQEEE